MNISNFSFQHVCINDWQWLLPELTYSSAEIEQQLAPLYQKLNLNNGRLQMMTGVENRRYWPKGTLPGDISAIVARQLMARHPDIHGQLDLLINASVCRDQLEPATAARVHAKLELPSHTAFFDLSNACLGVIQSMALAANLIESGMMKSILIVAAENSGPLIEGTLKKLQGPEIGKKELRPYIANLTIGSGAVAILMTHTGLLQGKNHTQMKIKSATTRTRSSAFHLCRGSGDVHQLEMYTDSEQLLHEGIALAKESWRASNLSAKNLTAYLTHQVGMSHGQLLREALGLESLESFDTYPYLGNTGPVALPITLMHFIEKRANPLPTGSKLALLGIGSGLSSTILELETLA